MRHSIFLLLVSITLSSSVISNEIEKYDPMVDSFLYIDQNQKNLPSDIFIMNLKEVITKEDPLYNNIKRGIREYEDRKNSINDLQYKFDNGLEAEGGKKVIEDIYLVNNPNNFYLTGSVLAAFIVAPLITDISEIFDWFSGEKEESDDPFYDADEEEESRNKRDKNIKKLGRYTFLPGVSIIAIGYFGSKIKIAQEKKIINDDDLVMSNLLEFFKKNEINMAIKIYNNRTKI